MRRVVWRSFWASRAIVWVTGVLAAAQLNANGVLANKYYDANNLTTPFGYFGNLLVSPFARWDSVWYLAVAKWGYGLQTSGRPLSLVGPPPPAPGPRMAFYPLYPGLIHVVGWIVRSDLIAGILISMVAFAIGLVLLHKLVRLDYSQEVADVTVMLVAFAPMSLYFSAVYSEALFLALSVGCIYCARTDRWVTAGVLGLLGAATRTEGVLLVVPMVFLLPRPASWAIRNMLRVLLPLRRILGIGLVPLGLIGYLAYLALKYHTSLSAPIQAPSIYFSTHRTWPFAGVWQGGVALFHAFQQLVHGPTATYVPAYAGSAQFNAVNDIIQFGFLVVGAVALVGGILRRLPVAYSAYALLSLAVPLSAPVQWQPLSGLSRYEVVIFPLFIWMADFLVRKRLTVYAIAASAMLLAYFTAEFVTWNFVS